MSVREDAAIRFEGVSKSFGATQVLRDLSFQVPGGTALSILGRRGTAKTMILKLCIGLLDPDCGRIFLNKEEVTAPDAESLFRVRRSTGFVFQNSAIFDSVSVAENVAFPLRYNSGRPESEIQERVHELLLQVGLENDGDKMAFGLSSGMRKLLGFARALACDPAVLLLDDPWNGLDSVTAVQIRTLLLNLKQQRGVTLLVIDNKLADARQIADQVAVLDEGRLIACGPPNEAAHCEHPVVKQFVCPGDF